MDRLRQGFAANLKELRNLTGISQERLAELAELDRTEISLLERGRRMPRLDTIVSLVRGLELDSADPLLRGLL